MDKSFLFLFSKKKALSFLKKRNKKLSPFGANPTAEETHEDLHFR
jgi:hypothetical protein